jgi:DNA recombination protein RmuC
METGLVIAGVLVGALLGIVIGFLVGRQGSAELRAQLAAQEATFGDRLNTVVLETTQRVSEGLVQRNAEDAEARLATQQATLQGVVGPVQTKLAELEQTVKAAERSRTEADTTVLNRLETVTKAAGDLNTSTAQLRTALEGGQTRGKWGEFQLQRILEVAGLTEHVTWQTQVQEGGGRGAQRPDLVVHIPEGRVLVVDAKAPTLDLDGDGVAEETDKAYAKRLRDHITALGRRDYIEGIPNAVGYVFLFLPSEAAYAGALRADPDVLVFAAERRVAVVAPSTLLSALTVVESIWREFEANEHLEDAVQQARQLHERLMVFAGHLGKVGNRLEQAVTSFNKAVGSLEGNVYPAARRMEAANLAPNQAILIVDTVQGDGVRRLRASTAPIDAPILPADTPAHLGLVDPKDARD